MAANVDEILPKASDVMMRIAEAQAKKLHRTIGRRPQSTPRRKR